MRLTEVDCTSCLATGRPIVLSSTCFDASIAILAWLGSSLIPNLVEAVKGYVKHEKTVLENVTKARSALMGAGSLGEKAAANDMLTGALKSLFAVAEAYPDLKASENFKELQQELSDTETKVAASRQFYNTNVLDLNNSIEQFPSSLVASMFGFTKEEFFKASEEEKKDVKVKF